MATNQQGKATACRIHKVSFSMDGSRKKVLINLVQN